VILVDSLPIDRVNPPDHLPGVEAWTLPPACSDVDDDAVIGDRLENALHFLGGSMYALMHSPTHSEGSSTFSATVMLSQVAVPII